MRLKNLASLLVMLLMLAMPSSVCATSAYDGLVDVAGSALIGGGACDTEDVTYSWSSLVHDSSISYSGGSTARTTVLSALDTALANSSGVSLVQQTSYDTNILHYLSVIVTPSSNAATFNTYTGYPGDHQYLKVANSYSIDIYRDGYDSCITKLYFSSSSTDRILAQPHDINYCYGGFCDKRQPVFVDNPVTYVSGYTGTTIPTEIGPAKYVAMGDSFSSGEGNPDFEYGTDNDSVNECHRSSKAYPRLLGIDTMKFVACSGATTGNVLYGGSSNGAWGEEPQVDALSGVTELVTITVGGNDVGFRAFAEKCVSPVDEILLDQVCDEYTDVYQDVTSEITTSLPDKLEGVYAEILDLAPNADIYVGGYPTISPYKEIEDPFDQDCGGLYDEFPNLWGDARAANDVVNLLNSVIEDAVNAVNYGTSPVSVRLHYVDVATGSFVGHDVCESDSFFNGIDMVHPVYSVHPNQDGQAAYAEDFEGVID